MNVGIGLPTTLPGTRADDVFEWASRADDGVFSSLGIVERLVYNALDPLITLSAVAAATKTVGLVTMVVIGPLRNSAVLAKETATIDSISGGRLTLGVSIGGRHDDYDATGMPHAGRGDRLTEQLVDLRTYWERSEVAPMTATGFGPRLLVGGTNDLAFLRMARYADGYVMGGGPPKLFARMADRARSAWAELGRPGRPALWAQGYFALGDEDALERGRAYIRDYYSFTGPFAERIADAMLDTPQAVAQFVRGYSEAGCDELVLFPTVGGIEQLDRLRDALGGSP